MPSNVTVVMMTRDRREAVLVVLERLCSLPEQPPIIVVDNASPDRTVDVVTHAFPDVTVIGLDRNEGACARTWGVRAARTPYVAFADDDSWWAPGSLAVAETLFERHPRLALLTGQVKVGRDELPDPINDELATSELGTRTDAPGPSVLGFLACAAVVRRDAYLSVGGFSPVLFFFGEENLLAQDLRAAGWQVCFSPELVVHHHPSSVPDRRSGRAALGARNALLTVWLRRRGSALASATLRALRRHGPVDGLRGLAAALVRLPEVRRERRPLPPDVDAMVETLDRARAARIAHRGHHSARNDNVAEPARRSLRSHRA